MEKVIEKQKRIRIKKDVFKNASAEEINVLLNNADVVAKARKSYAADISSVNKDLAFGNVIKTGNKI